jgi:hypothetical protein
MRTDPGSPLLGARTAKSASDADKVVRAPGDLAVGQDQCTSRKRGQFGSRGTKKEKKS